jgi:hypothetical protein
MPGKYSHGLVLAQYSGQGIISLPNDDFLKLPPHAQAASAPDSRSRTLSNATRSSAQKSIASRSIKSASAASRPTPRIFTDSETPPRQRRVVIVDSDSESDDGVTAAQDEEWVRTVPRPVSQTTEVHSRKTSGSFRPQTPKSHQSAPSFANHHADRDMPPLKGFNAQRSEVPANTPGKRGGGVRALIQARNQVETRQSGALPGDSPDDVNIISLKEILEVGPKSQLNKKKKLTVQQFLDKMPDPEDDRETDESDGNELNSRMMSATDSKPMSAYQQQTTLNRHGLAKQRSKTLVKATDRLDEVGSQTNIPTEPLSHAEYNVRAISVEDRVADEARLDSIPIPKKNPRRQLDPAFRARAASPYSLQHAEPPQHKPKSSVSSYNSGLSSSIGKSSLGTQTQATSGYSPLSRKTLKTTDAKDEREYLTLRTMSDDSFTDVIHDINHVSAFYSSDEAETEEQDCDLPTPKLQSIPETELMTSHWGMISAGQNVLPRVLEEDELSEVSAVFPPDIGRYRYAGAGEGPLALALRGNVEDSRKARPTRGSQPVTRKNDREGLFQKLRSKVKTTK